MGNCCSSAEDTHYCDLKRLEDKLDEVSPHTPYHIKVFHKFRTITVISPKNPLTKEFFRSNASIVAERQRHNKTGYRVIVHPLSIFNHYRQRLLILIWMCVFYKNTFTLAYFPRFSEADDTFWKYVDIVTDFLLFVDVILNFCTGYQLPNSKQVVLAPKKIICRYFITYFTFELIGTVPVADIAQAVNNRVSRPTIMFLSILRFGRFVRLHTMLKYLEDLGHDLRLNASIIICFCQLLMSLYYLHWLACIIYVVPCVEYYTTNEFPPTSWITQAQIEPFSNTSTLRKYLHCLLCVACHFFSAGCGMYRSDYLPEQVVFSLILILGSIYITYLLALVIQIFGSVNASESKYEELLYQLVEYMRSKRLPPALKERLLIYYENKFQKCYFREEVILSALPEHLRYEVFLHNCRSLILKVNLFQGLSKTAVGSVIGYLKPEVYLSGDVVAKYGEACEDVWFISYGAIAIFKKDGTELTHLEDGDYFGGAELSEKSETYKINAIAVAITELFRMSKIEFYRLVKRHRELHRRLQKFSQKYSVMLRLVDDRTDTAEDRKNVLEELKKGRILEKPKERK